MKILQANIQSCNTFAQSLKIAINRNNIDIVMLQEVWRPEKGIRIKDFHAPFQKLHDNDIYGGVAILIKNKTKCVHLKEYDDNRIDAVWVEIRIKDIPVVIGSVYIPPRHRPKLFILQEIIGKIKLKFQNILISMDANCRNSLLYGRNPFHPKIEVKVLKWVKP